MAFSELSGGHWRPLYNLSPETVKPTNQVTEAVNASTTKTDTDANPVILGVCLEYHIAWDREREREKERDRDRERYRQREKEVERQSQRHIEIYIYIYIYII